MICLDPVFCQNLLEKHVFYFSSFPAETWVSSITILIRKRLKSGSFPQLEHVKKIGQQKSSNIWVFGPKCQYQPNGSPIPGDMISDHFTDQDIIKTPVQSKKGKIKLQNFKKSIFGRTLISFSSSFEIARLQKRTSQKIYFFHF